MTGLDCGGDELVDELIELQPRGGHGRTPGSRVVRADQRVVDGEGAEHKAEIALDPTARAVGQQQRGTAAPQEDVEVARGDRLLSDHADDAKV
ncbi:hypothetical protein GCM10027597_51990 [Saccharopolyspora tripterygii]